MEETLQYLEEKKILQFGGGARFGQVVFLAGGSGSGKGFAQNFLDVKDFKIFDVDRLKTQFLALAKVTGKYPEIQNMSLKNPDHVNRLHMFIKAHGVVDRQFDAFLASAAQSRGQLPNLLFDETLKDLDGLYDILPRLFELGYKPQNVHIIWVLADFHIAMARNRTRDRVVPEDILMKTHEGAAKTMYQIIKGNIPSGVDGAVGVILNTDIVNVKMAAVEKAKTDYKNVAPVATEYRGKNAKGDLVDRMVVHDFPYISIKGQGEPMKTEKEVQKQIFEWMEKYIPRNVGIGYIFSAISSR